MKKRDITPDPSEAENEAAEKKSAKAETVETWSVESAKKQNNT